MIKVLINGCNGKMGQEVAKAIKKTQDVEILCGFDRIDTGDNTFPVFTDINNINLIPDVIIDFSIPQATLNILEFAQKNKIPTVIATTGLSDIALEKIENYSKEFPIFRSANMEIVETHHNRKIDSPSGTALILADSINNALENSMYYEYNRHGKREKRNKKEIGIHSIRGGNEVGKHTVIFFGDDESLEITHNVNSRGVFANGAIKAAQFIVHKDSGLYNMNDLC